MDTHVHYSSYAAVLLGTFSIELFIIGTADNSLEAARAAISSNFNKFFLSIFFRMFIVVRCRLINCKKYVSFNIATEGWVGYAAVLLAIWFLAVLTFGKGFLMIYYVLHGFHSEIFPIIRC